MTKELQINNNKKSGFITLFRSIEENPIWKQKPFSKGQAWIDILLECNFEDKDVLIKNSVIKCKRGESLNCLKTWSDRWGWTIGATRQFISTLKDLDMITTFNTTRLTTHLKVNYYDKYQTQQLSNQSQSDFKPISNQSQSALNNNINNITIKDLVENFSNENPEKQNPKKYDPKSWNDILKILEEKYPPELKIKIGAVYNELKNKDQTGRFGNYSFKGILTIAIKMCDSGDYNIKI